MWTKSQAVACRRTGKWLVPRSIWAGANNEYSAPKKGYGMSTINEFRCEGCGRETTTPVHWFVIQCSSDELKLMKWNTEAASAKGARHCCGEAHAQVYVSRWLEAACSPPKPDFMRSSSAEH
jgi:hypothetical protein